MGCNIVINQQLSAPDPETKVKDLERQRWGKKSHETYMKKVKERVLKDNQKTQVTLKEFINYFQKDLNDPAPTLIAIEETMRIMKEEHNTEINISIGPCGKCLIKT